MALKPLQSSVSNPDAAAAAVLAGSFAGDDTKIKQPITAVPSVDDDAPFGESKETSEAVVTPPLAAKSSAVATYNDAKAKGIALTRAIAELFLSEGTSVPFGDFIQFKAGAGGKLASGDVSVKPLGRWMKGTVLSIGKRLEIGPGVEGATYKKYVGFSDDSATMTRIIGAEEHLELAKFLGRPVQEYLDWLRSNDLPNADSREFTDVVFWVERTQAPDAETGTAVMLSLPPTSAAELRKYFNQLKMSCVAAAQGLKGASIPDEPFSIFAWAEAASKGDKSWTKLKFGRALPDSVA